MNKHRLLGMVAALLLMGLLCAVAAGEGAHLGEAMYDFTVRTSDGGQFTLSQALQSSGAVLINIFKINCQDIKPNWNFVIPISEIQANPALEGWNNPDPTAKVKGPSPVGQYSTPQ